MQQKKGWIFAALEANYEIYDKNRLLFEIDLWVKED